MKTTRVITALGGVMALGMSSGVAVAQTESTTSQSISQCPVIHLVVANGSGDSALSADVDSDQGWGAQLTVPLTSELNDSSAAAVAPSFTSTAAASQVAESTQTDDAGWVTYDTQTVESDSWKNPDAWATYNLDEDSAASSTPSSAVQDFLPTTVVESYQGGASASSSTETTTSSEVTSSLVAVADDEGGEVVIGRSFVPYPSSIGGAYIPRSVEDEGKPYGESVEIGVDRAHQILDDLAQQCPDTKAFLVGYSQGAHVMSEVARDIGNGQGEFEESDVAGVALFADPSRATGAPVVASGADTPAAAPGSTGQNVAQLGDFSSPDPESIDGGGMMAQADDGDYGALADRTVSWCVDGDLFCDLPIAGPVAQLLAGVGEQLDITDPAKSINVIADALNPAVMMQSVSELSDDLDFGAGGFNTSLASVSSPVSDTHLGKLMRAGVQLASESVEIGSGVVTGQISTADAMEVSARAFGDAVEPLAEVAADVAHDLVVGVGMLGGMGFGAGLGIAKEQVTPENIAEISAAAAVSPETAGMTVGRQLVASSKKVVNANSLVGSSKAVLEQTDFLGLDAESVGEVAVQATTSGAAHSSYSVRAATNSGETAMDKTKQWITAVAADLGSARAADAVSSQPSSNGVVSFDPSVFEGFLGTVGVN